MRRVFDLWRRFGAVPASGVPDDELLHRFARNRDPDAFAALLNRHGPLVYGACRRLLPDPLDVEDAFQAAFLVLVRRAEALRGRPVGPWLHRVAVLTARSLRRRNAVRFANASALVEVAARPSAPDARLDVDAALSALPRKYREPVILCHLQGWTRRELADHLGCPESTAASLVARGLAKLRHRLAGCDPAVVLAVAGSAVVPPTLTAAAVRAAIVYATSFSDAAVPPAVAALTNGVLRMVRLKKLAAVSTVLVAVLALGAGLVGWPAPSARAQPGQPNVPASDRAKVERELEAAKRRVEELEAERKRLAEAEQNATPRLLIEVGGGPSPRIVVTEFKAGGKAVGTIETTSLEMLGRFLARSRNDTAGPKTLSVRVDERCPQAVLKEFVATVKAAGFDPLPFTVVDAVSGPAPVELGAKSLPPYVIEPPDMLSVEVVVKRKDPKNPVTVPLPVQPISGPFQVRPDGTVGLGYWGNVALSGRTLDEAVGVIRSHVAGSGALKNLGIGADALAVIVDVVAYNSKRYYVILGGGDAGDQVIALPVTGSDTVLDALANSQIAQVAIKPGTEISLARMEKGSKEWKILPVDWVALTQHGITHTNYQLVPGDRIHVKPKK
ncbi:ECF RNA polymerase sigma factor SigE [Gemmata sp. SH-PL17]|uniref:sigma-70 family RNA polymerase sigma factor n=1 Tax=Gemmata sp. SH-PL17 TaxID=1630693 RepID=UPI00078E4E26|nr:sigma-70 family RNA polymerase sigma factor [Gemmata sp. SH-PL17]AMV24202.1 ECF RNA polymerase sigma factor SigE [Gemmata sp. SH-PL17]